MPLHYVKKPASAAATPPLIEKATVHFLNTALPPAEPDDLACYRAMLALLDPNCDRDLWRNLGFVVKDAGLLFEDFRQWSAGSPSKYDLSECKGVWNYKGKPANPATIGTLIKAAQEAGYAGPWPSGNPVAAHSVAVPVTESNHPTSLPVIAQQAAIAALEKKFNTWPVAPVDHPYLVKKGLGFVPNDIRLVPPGATTNFTNWLAVPQRLFDGAFRSVEFISPDGNKKSASGCPKDGVFIIPPENAPAAWHVAEGMATAATIFNAAPCSAVVVTFGSGNFPAVAKALREKNPTAKIVLCPDVGKEKKAQEIAAEVGGHWVELPVGKPNNFDWNDLGAEINRQTISELLKNIKTPTASPSRYELKSAGALMAAPPLKWLVRGVLPQEGMAALYGPPGSGKSFLALDLCAAVALGVDWFGRSSMQAPVVYICLEGEAGLGKRIKAWTVENKITFPEQLSFVTQAFDLRLAQDVDDLAAVVLASGGAGGLTVIDTLNRAAPGADENSPKDMGEVIAGCNQLRERIGGAVLIIHHTGKDTNRGLRGHSSLLGALDVAIETSRTQEQREWWVEKARDDADGERNGFKLRRVEMGYADDDNAITSCVIVPTDIQKFPDLQQVILNVFHEAKASGFGSHSAKDMSPDALVLLVQEYQKREEVPVSRSDNVKRSIDRMVKNKLFALKKNIFTQPG